MVKAWTRLTTQVGRLANTTLGYGRHTSSITPLTQGIAMSNVSHDNRTQYDIVRMTAYKNGAQAMKDKMIADIAWFADEAPNKDAANHIWRIITHLMQIPVEARNE